MDIPFGFPGEILPANSYQPKQKQYLQNTNLHMIFHPSLGRMERRTYRFMSLEGRKFVRHAADALEPDGEEGRDNLR